VAKSSRAAQGYGLPLDAPKTGAKRLDLLAGPQRPSNNGCAFRPVVPPMAQSLVEPIESRLSILEPLSIVPAQSREELSLFDWLLWRYHYLPYSGAAGENIKYWRCTCRIGPITPARTMARA